MKKILIQIYLAIFLYQADSFGVIDAESPMSVKLLLVVEKTDVLTPVTTWIILPALELEPSP